MTTTTRYMSEGEQAWLQLRREWTTRAKKTTTTNQASGPVTPRRAEGHGVQKSVNGALALDDFNLVSRQLRERLPLADMVAILHDLWEEDCTTL